MTDVFLTALHARAYIYYCSSEYERAFFDLIDLVEYVSLQKTHERIQGLVPSTNFKNFIIGLKEEKIAEERKKKIENCKDACVCTAAACSTSCALLKNAALIAACAAAIQFASSKCNSCCETGFGRCVDKIGEAVKPYLDDFFYNSNPLGDALWL